MRFWLLSMGIINYGLLEKHWRGSTPFRQFFEFTRVIQHVCTSQFLFLSISSWNLHSILQIQTPQVSYSSTRNAVSLCCSLRQPIPCIPWSHQNWRIPLYRYSHPWTCLSTIQCCLPHGSVCMNGFMLYPQCSEMLLVFWWCKLWSVVWSNSKTISHSDPERHQVMHCQQPWSFLPFVTCGIEDVPLSFLNKNQVCCEI